MIGIIDYGMGNLRSVQKALERLGNEAEILRSPRDAASAERLVLPGVGAFADGMANLQRGGWIDAIHTYVESGRPFLGICLGMQLLFDGSEEDAPSPDRPVPGLAILPGRVVRFREDRGGPDHTRIKVPHMGWNGLEWHCEDPLLQGLRQGEQVYFVHSYHVNPDESDGPLVSAWADYAGRFCATVWRDNVWAAQFHPEKSQHAGLKILENFAMMNVAAA